MSTPTFAYRSCSFRQGFTLVEILVVLLIVTIIAGVTITRLPALVRTADLDTESRRIELLFNMVRTEAMLDSVEYGFRLTDPGYEFLLFDDGSQSWRKTIPPFHERKIPEQISITIKSDNKEFKLLGEGLPPILVLSSGETTPFELVIESRIDLESRTLSTDGYGEFNWQDDE